MTPDFEKRIAQYLALRDKRDEIKKRHQDELDKINGLLDQLGDYLQACLNNTRQDSARTKIGTAFIDTKRSATIADAAAFRRHVIGLEAWDLVDWRANAPAVTKLIEETGEAPPGVNYSTRRVVKVRRNSNGE